MKHATRHTSLRETAAAWHESVHREYVSDDIRAAFASWMAEAPEHRAAYQEVERVWCNLKATAHDPEILALRHETALRLTRGNTKSTRALMWGAVAIALLIVGAGLVFLGTHGHFPGALLADAFGGHRDGRYITATGERLAVTLNDGSQLTLNTQTELDVAFTRTERRVHLIRGQAIFEVAKDPGRPFVVEAHRRRFIAVGTAFDVRLDGARINVTMIEGTVRVERAGDQTPAPRPAAVPGADSDTTQATLDAPPGRQRIVTTITSGEQLTVDSESQVRVHSADPEHVTSWRRGQIIFENERLIDAIAEINRYSDKKIELTEPALADLRLSGGFATSRPAVFIEAITTYFPIRVEHADEHVIVLSARK